MTVSQSVTQSFAILGVVVDTVAPAITVTFARLVNGADIGGPTYRLEGAEYGAVFGVPGDANKTRGADMADAMYAAALAAGVITGTAD